MADVNYSSGLGPPAPDDYLNPYLPEEVKKKKPIVSLVDAEEKQANHDEMLVRSSLIGHQDTNPDDYAKSIETAKKVGVHPDLVHVERDAWEKDRVTQLNTTIASVNPELAKWLYKDPANVQTSRDDLPTLDRLTRLLKRGWDSPITQVAAGPILSNLRLINDVTQDVIKAGDDYNLAYEAHQYGMAAYKYQAGDVSVLPKLLEYEAKQKERQPSGASWVTATFAEFLGGTAAQLPEAVMASAAGAGVGAVATAATGPGVIAGTATGATVGLLGSFSIQTGLAASGSIYRELDLMRDPYGTPIDESVKQVMAITGGTLVGGLNLASGTLAKSAVVATLKNMAADVGIRQGITEAVTAVARYGYKAAILNVAQTLAEELSKEIALEATNAGGGHVGDERKYTAFDTIFNSPEKIQELGAKAVEAAGKGFLLGSTLGVGPAVSHARIPTKLDKVQIIANQNRLDQALEITRLSRQMERDPAAMADLADGVDKQPIGIPLEIVVANRKAFEFIPDLDKQLASAETTGTEIQTTVGQYMTNVPPELHPEIKDYVRQGDGWSPAEMKAIEEAQKALKEHEKAIADTAKAAEAAVPPTAPGIGAQVVQALQPLADQLPDTIPAQQLNLPGLETSIQLPEIQVKPNVFRRLLTDRREAPPIDLALQKTNELRLKAGLTKIETPPTPETQLEFSLHPPEPHVFPPTPEGPIKLGPVSEDAVLIKRAKSEQTIRENPLPKEEAELLFIQEFKGQIRAVKLKEDQILEAAVRRDPKTMEEFHRFIDEEAKRVAQVEREAALKHEESRVEGILRKEGEEVEPTRKPGEITEEEMVSIWGSEKVFKSKEGPPLPTPPAEIPGVIDTKVIHSVADIAYSNWATKLMQTEGEAVVNSLDDLDARLAASQTGAAIEKQRKLMWLSPLFESPKAMGLIVKDFARYSKHIQEVQRKLTKSVFDAANKIIRQKETAQWKVWAKEIGPEVADAVARRPEVFLPDYLITGKVRFKVEGKLPPVKLIAADVDSLFTRDELTAMGVREGENISDTLPSKMFIKDPTRQISADNLATVFQQGDGKTLIRNLMENEKARVDAGETNTQRYSRLVNEEINRRLTDEHGDMEQNILERSVAAAVDVAQLDVLTDEMKALSNGVRIDNDSIVKHIRTEVGKLSVEEASRVEHYQTQTGKYGNAAEQALLAGDYVSAFKAKQNQYMFLLRTRMAVELKQQQAETGAIMRKYASRPAVDSVTPEYNARILEFLRAAGVKIGQSRDDATLNADIKSFKGTGHLSLNEWIANRQERGEIISQPTFLEEMKQKGQSVEEWKALTVDQFNEFRTVLSELDNVGTDSKFVQTVGSKLAHDLVVESVRESLSPRLGQPERYRTDVESGVWRAKMRGFDASLLKIETLLTWLDANDPNGPMTQYFFRPFKEGQAKMEKLQEKFAKQIQENVPLHLKLKEATENRWLTDEYGNMMPIKRTNMFGIAGLFFGNEESRKKLLDGYKWNEQDVYEYLLTNMKSIDDWHYLDSIYRVWDELTAEKSNVYRQVRGYGWEPPPAMTYFDRYGNERKGGYWSIVDSDSDSTQFREQQGLVDRRQFNPLPSATVQLESTKGMLRPSLDFETLGYRIKETLHDISFRPAVVNALRMLEDRQILGLVKDSYGKEYGDTIERWVSDMANDSGWRDDIGATVATKLFRYVGQAAIVHLVGFSPATAIIHSGSAAANTVGELKWQSISATYKVVGDTLLKSSDMLFRNPRNLELATNFAWENSPELQSRWNKDNFNLVKALGHWSNLQTIQWSYNRWAQSFISLTDYMTAVVAWHAQYTNSTNDGKSHEDAVFMADRLVRAAHGGVSQLDKAAIQRSLNLAPFTMFYGYFNHNYNQFRRFSHEINEGTAATKQEFMNDEYGKIAKRMSGPFWQGMMYFAAYGLVPALIHEAVRGKEEEEFDLPSFLGKAVLSQGAGMVPFFRDFAYSFLHPGVQSGGIPLMQVWGAAGTISRGAKKVWEGEWPKPSEAQALLIPLKLGSKTLGRFADYMFDSEQDAPRNVREWKNLTIYGQPTMPGVRRKKARPARTGHDYRQ